LWQIGQVLTVPVSFFFDGLDGIKPTTDPLVNEREIRLCHGLRKLSGPRQKCLFDLVNTFAGSDIGGDAGGGKP